MKGVRAMAPVSKFALQVTLNDGTLLWVNRDGPTPVIENVKPSERVALQLQTHIEEYSTLTTEPLSDDQILEQYVLSQLRIYSGDSRRRPAFISGELVTLEILRGEQNESLVVCSASIKGMSRL